MPNRPYNRYPQGLLGLLDAKVRGQTPNEITDYTQASIELAPFLLQQMSEVVTETTGVLAATGRAFGANGTLTVPQDEAWYVLDFGVRPSAILAAGVTTRFWGMLDTTLATGTVSVGTFPQTGIGSGTVGERPYTGPAAPFLASPGDQLGVWIESVTGAGFTAQLMAKFARLRV